MSLLQDYAKYVEPLEVPDIFHLWCSVSMIAACAQRKIWLDMGHFVLSPNFYIVLNSPPGKCKKSTAMNIVRNMLATIPGVQTKSDSITKEKIYLTMEKGQTVSESAPGKALTHSSLTIFANEMSLLIKKGDKDFVSALVSLYDQTPVFKHSTKNMGENVIPNPFMNILGGTTPDWIAMNLHEDMIAGGFSARALIIFSDTPKEPNPWPTITPEGKEAHKRIMLRLEQIAQICGAFHLDPKARDFYTQWYKSHKMQPCKNPKMAPFLDRKDVHMLKLGMIISLAEKDELVLRYEDLVRALVQLDLIQPLLEKSLEGIGRNVLSPLAQEILAQISYKKRVNLAELFVANYYRTNKQEFEEIIEALEKMNRISREQEIKGKELVIWLNYIPNK